MAFRVVLYSPDRAVVYDGRTPDQTGVGGGITARLSLLGPLAAQGHDVTAYVNCRERIQHGGVTYVPLDDVRAIETDVFIAMTTGGDLSFAPLRGIDVRARLKMIWVQGVPKPADLEAVGADRFVTASRFLRDVLVERWGVPFDRIFPCYNGLHQERFEEVEAGPALARDPYAMAYIGPPEKGLTSAIEVLRRLRTADARYHLDVFGGGRLWGRAGDETPLEPGVRSMGLVGQAALIPKLFEYEYCLAPQAMEEGFGIAVQEARRAGQIALVSRVGAFPELIRDGHDGFLVDAPHTSAASHDRMAEIVRTLAADPGKRAVIRRRAIDAASTFSWTEAARTWADYWNALLESPNLPISQSPNHPRDPRVLIAGYYGHGNLGDEAILEALLTELRSQMPSLQVTVASGDPAATREMHRVDAVHERDVPALIETARRSTAIVVGGGGLFQDYFGLDERTMLGNLHWGLTYLAAFPVLAAETRRPFVLCGVGVGPLKTADGRRYTRTIFERASLATVRDRESRDLLAEIGVPVERIAVTADPAFLIRPSAAVPSESRGRAVVVLRAWDQGVAADTWEPAVAEALDHVVESGLSVLFVPFQATAEDRLTDDVAVVERVRARMRHGAAAAMGGVGLTPREVQGVFASASLVVTMRLHGVILAASAGVPVVALAYDPKVRAAMRQIGREEDTIDLTSVRDEWRTRVRSALRTSSTVIADLRAAAKRNVTELVTLLRRDSIELPVATPEWTTMLEAALVERGRYAAVIDARAGNLAISLAEQERVVAQAAAETAQARRDAEEAARALAARDAEIAAQAGRMAAMSADIGELWGQINQLQAEVNRRPVRAYLALRRAPRAVLRRTLVAPIKRVVRVAARWLMTSPSYAFDRYKRSRITTYGADLSGLVAPGEAGLVSIVLPVYNGAGLVGEAIESTLRQTYSNLELIIVNDGSTDDTGRIANEAAAKDSRVRVIHQENQRLPAALSRGFRAVRGEFVTWTSADNRMKPACVEKLVGCLRRHPSWDVAYANLDVIDEAGAFWRNSPHYEGYQRPAGSEHVHLPETTAELNVVANNSVGAAFLYRSRVASLLGDYSRHRFVMEDYDYWMRANALLTVRHADFDEPIYDYRFHSRSLTSRWEEFDMLGNRERLMVFDDFRRDFFLLPMVWMVEAGSSDPAGLTATFETRVREAGHLIHRGEYPLADLSRWSVPVVYARLTHDPSAEGPPRADVPAGALKVLMTDAGALPDRVADGWDVCAAIGSPAAPPRLAKEFQGWLVATDMATLVHALDVRAKSAHVERIEAVIEGKAEAEPASATCKASVIICTRRWSDRLERALAAVAAQRTSYAFEVIVVDNSGRDDVRSGGGRAMVGGGRVFRPGETGHARVVICPITGLSAARNAGLAEARGEVVCFLDDDALPEPDWLEWICRAFDAHPATGVVGGHIRLKMPARVPTALRPGWRKYWSEFLTEYKEYTEVGEWALFPWGANWSARRNLLRAAGGFRTNYGRTGNNYWGGEEMVAASLIQRLGGRIAVEPRASVLHDVDPARFTLSHVLRTMVAGYQVYHRAQNDLYVPRQDRVVALLRRLRATDFDRSVGYGRLRWVDAALRKYAQAALLVTEISDLRRRARRPVVEARSR